MPLKPEKSGGRIQESGDRRQAVRGKQQAEGGRQWGEARQRFKVQNSQLPLPPSLETLKQLRKIICRDGYSTPVLLPYARPGKDRASSSGGDSQFK
jgi:hypothetical protein